MKLGSLNSQISSAGLILLPPTTSCSLALCACYNLADGKGESKQNKKDCDAVGFAESLLGPVHHGERRAAAAGGTSGDAVVHASRLA